MNPIHLQVADVEGRLGLAINRVAAVLRDFSEIIHTPKWQGIDISTKPEMAMHEVRHVDFRVEMISEDLAFYREQIQPSIPWADDHFLERVCGEPINPGIQWAKWPWGQSAKNFLDARGKFNHNYMERYWPRQAGRCDATSTDEEYREKRAFLPSICLEPRRGIYHEYGDLFDVVHQLAKEPTTRQAILPVFFPEDTGAVHGGRIPCSMYYHFLMRNNRMDVVYAIRSCDFMRHFRDDVYLTIRLVLWVLDELRQINGHWDQVMPGQLVMHIASLHCFRNDYVRMFKKVAT